MKKYISDILLAIGGALMTTGVSLIYIPAGIIFAGALLVVFAVACAKTRGGG